MNHRQPARPLVRPFDPHTGETTLTLFRSPPPVEPATVPFDLTAVTPAPARRLGWELAAMVVGVLLAAAVWAGFGIGTWSATPDIPTIPTSCATTTGSR